MRLFLLSQSTNRGYDTFDSCIVAAKNEKDAILMHPSRNSYIWKNNQWMYQRQDGTISLFSSRDWTSPKDVTCEYIGQAKPDTEACVILASFNAG
jgi:hypothetical protein